MSAQDIADLCGVTLDKVKYQMRKHQIRVKEDPELSPPKRRDTPWNKGKTYKNPKAGLHNKGKPAKYRGVDHHWYKGGTSSDRALIGAWAQRQAHDVHKSNNFKCVICQNGSKLRAHHIVPVAKDESLGKELSNLTTLCSDCHSGLHARNLEEEFIAAHEAGTTRRFWDDHDRTMTKAYPEWKTRPSGNKLIVSYSDIENIEFLGRQTVYQVAVGESAPSYVANGFIVQSHDPQPE